MLVVMEDKTITFDNKQESVADIITWIEENANKSDKHFSHLVIDDVEVYEQYEFRLSEQIELIEKIEVILNTEQELLNEIFISGESYLLRALPEIKVVVDELYQGMTEQGKLKLEQLMEAIQWLNQLVEAIDQSEKHPSNFNDYLVAITTIKVELPNLEEALTVDDQILIADIVNYEIFPALESLQRAFTDSIDQEGVRKDVN